MTALALVLVLSSAVMHATWNMVAKREVAGQPFLFVAYVVGALAYTPFVAAFLVIAKPELGWIVLVFVAIFAYGALLGVGGAFTPYQSPSPEPTPSESLTPSIAPSGRNRPRNLRLQIVPKHTDPSVEKVPPARIRSVIPLLTAKGSNVSRRKA